MTPHAATANAAVRETAPMTPDYARLRRTEAGAEFRRRRDLLLDHRDDWAAARAGFTWPRPRFFNWALEWFDVVAAGAARPALRLVDGDDVTTVGYGELSARSDQVANWLTGLEVRRGDRVLVVLGQRVELWETLLACLKIGAVVIPTYTSLTAAEAADRLHRGRIRHVISGAEAAPTIQDAISGGSIATKVVVGEERAGWTGYEASWEAPARYLPEAPTPAGDLAFAYFTSGTTAQPKLVTHTHVSYPVGHLSSMYFNGLVPGDRHLNISAPGWAKHSWSSLFVPFTAEATLIVVAGTAPDPRRIPELAERHAATSLCAPPSTWARIARHLNAARPRLREATSAGEPLPPDVAAAVEEAWGVSVRDGYGQTETTALIGTTPGMPRRPGRLGRPLPGWDIRLDDGEICVDLAGAPVGLMAGYEDVAGHRTVPSRDGLYRTGDIGDVDADGYIRVLGRADDVFKSGGHRVSPYELEAVLRTHPAVRDAAVIPVPHATLGQAAHAVVELHGRPAGHGEAGAAHGDRGAGHGDGRDHGEGAAGHAVTPGELLAHVDARVTPALRVHTVEFTACLPRTMSGKVRRSALRAVHRPAAP